MKTQRVAEAMPPSTPPPAFVFVNGASVGPWAWERVLPKLRAPALVADLSCRSTTAGRRAFTLERGARELADTLAATEARDVVLVGHSIGGLLATGAAHLAPGRVRKIVHLGSYLPPKGKAHLSVAPPPVRLVMRAVLALQREGVLAPASALRKEYCNDLDDATAALVVERATREPARLFTDPAPWGPAPPPGVQATYVRLTNDRAVAPAVQARVAALLPGAEVVDVDSGHLPMLSRPDELARLLNDA